MSRHKAKPALEQYVSSETLFRLAIRNETDNGRPWHPLPQGHSRETRAFLAALFGSYRRGRRIRRLEGKALRQVQEAPHA